MQIIAKTKEIIEFFRGRHSICIGFGNIVHKNVGTIVVAETKTQQLFGAQFIKPIDACNGGPARKYLGS